MPKESKPIVLSKLTKQCLEDPVYSQTDVVVKYQKYHDFEKELNKSEASYLSDLNMSLYSNLEKAESLEILNLITDPPLKGQV